MGSIKKATEIILVILDLDNMMKVSSGAEFDDLFCKWEEEIEKLDRIVGRENSIEAVNRYRDFKDFLLLTSAFYREK